MDQKILQQLEAKRIAQFNANDKLTRAHNEQVISEAPYQAQLQKA